MTAREDLSAAGDPIAVVGMGCRFPGGARGVDGYWDLLLSGRSGVVEVPPDRWDVQAFYDANPEAPGRSYSRHGGFVDGVREFDAGLFGVPPREAAVVDPQHRFMLEVAWEALEHAGIAPDSLRGTRTGVFVGMGGSDFERLKLTPMDGYSATGIAQNFAANRLSYALGLEGPSLVVDTACSSSLVAAHLAVQALRAGECDIALAGGVNLMLSAETTVALSQGRMLSPDGQCKTFDADANGYVRGEGCGVVVLRRLSTARESGQRVLALLKGSATNQDGRSNGLTAPRGAAQEDVVRRALDAAGVAAADVGFVETHGTGTALGDPIEVRALSAVLGPGREHPVVLGAVKTNIGHLEAAAGIAGLIKAVLVVERGVIPPNLNMRTLNPYIPWQELPVTVPTETRHWTESRRIAGVSSFGFGGTNAHVVLESVPAETAADDECVSGPVVVKVSGRGVDAVRAGAARLASWLETAGDVDLEAVAWSANVGRADLADRAAVVADSTAELKSRLTAVADGRGAPGVVAGRRGGGRPRVGFVIPGQGPRLAGALAGIYGRVPVITEVVDEIAAVVGPVTGLPLSVLLDDSEESAQALQNTAVSQPALFTVAVALGRWWQSVGVEPDVVLGHSAGAYVAAVLGGVWSLADGVRLVSVRTRLMAEIPSDGAMAAIFCAPGQLADVAAIRSGEVVIASYNGPRESVISGPTDLVLAVIAEMTGRGIKAVRLRVSYGSHSPLMEPVLEPLRAAFDGVDLSMPATELVSDSSGELAGPEVATVDYWVRHTREPVRFDDAMRTMLDRNVRVVVELGPGGLLQLFMSVAGDRELVCVPSVVPEVGVHQGLLESAARVWAAGIPLDWTKVNGARPAQLPVLPTYPFQRQTYWPADAAEQAPAEVKARPIEPVPVTARVAAKPGGDGGIGELVAYLRTELADVMELADVDDLDPDTGLFDLGLTSLMVVRLRSRLERDLGTQVSTTSVFEHPTIRRLAGYLADLGGAAPAAPTVEPPRALPSASEPIAIVGMACRFPGGANDLSSYWQLLRDGRDATGPLPPGRWLGPAVRGGFLDLPVDEFDAEAFGVSPREARFMDPQQRLLLEVTWEALEDAGCRVADLDGSTTAVYVGVNTNDYLHLLSDAGLMDSDAYVATGNTASVAAGRLSYFLGTQGPSMAVDTACSSSLVATHLAARSLRSGEADTAIVAGVNLMLSPSTTLTLQRLGVLSPDGRCKTFDASADGYARGEGAGVVVLKRLSDAVAAGDRIWAVLRGSAVNQDGRSAGLTVPNGAAQQAVIRAALRDAAVDAASVGYVEAHGTGTQLGDPIEIDALVDVLRPDRDPAAKLRVGSVKTNLGHLEAAAGMSSLIKVALSLHHGRIPAHLHFAQPNEHVRWNDVPVEVPTELTEWDGPRVAGVSSFGFSGTNAHVVLEQAPAVDEPAASEPGPAVLLLSARTEPALRANAGAYQRLLSSPEAPAFADVVRAAALRRSHLPVRLAITAESNEATAELLAEVAQGKQPATATLARVVPPERRRLVMVFSGQGSQWAEMGRGLLADPVSAQVLRRCDEITRELVGWSLLDELCAPRETSRLADTEIAQPAIVAVQAALVAKWLSWGVTPDAVVGHSVGEIAAAFAAGSLTLDQAMTVAVRRGEVMASTKGSGAMAAVAMSERDATELIEPYTGLTIAAVNGPDSTVLAGDSAALAELEPKVRGRGIRWAKIQDEYAFHSPSMLAVRPDLLQALSQVVPVPPAVPVFSTVTGERALSEAFDAEYWADNMVMPVRFHDALLAASDPKAHNVIVEVGPHASLVSPAAQTLADRDCTVLTSMRSRQDSRATMLRAGGGLHVLGFELDLESLYGTTGRPVSLPAYQWQRTRHWLPEPPAVDAVAEHTYEIDWQVAQRPAEQVGNHGTWLLIADSRDLADRLRDKGIRCVVVSSELASSPNTLRGALDGAGPVHAIVHCAALDGSGLDHTIEASCGPVLAAAKAIADGDCRIWVVTRGGVAVDDTEVMPAHAPVWGLGRVVALEQPEIWGGLIDLDPGSADLAADAAAILAEVRSDSGEDQVAYRAGGRRIARLRKAGRLPAARAEIRGDATYLITGGRGALGLRTAKWLVDKGARHIVLTGRRPVNADTPAGAAIRELRAAGVSVHTPDVDVADTDAMAPLFSVDAAWPPIRGVVHAAGAFDACAVRDMDWDDFRGLLTSKVDGTLTLDALTSKLDLDFFVMFSSASAVWGSALAGHYAAANWFEDVMAHDRRRRGLPGLAVDWGWWSGSELVSGEHLRQFEAMGLHVLPDELGFAALDALLAADRAQLAVAPVDWSKYRPVMEARRRRPLLGLMGGQEQDASAVDDELLARLKESAPGTRRRLLTERLQREVAAVLGIENLAPHLGFFDAGMDSIMSVELKSRIERFLGVRLAPTAALEHPTIEALVAHLLDDVLALAAGEQPDVATEFDDLTEEELLKLLGDELEREQP